MRTTLWLCPCLRPHIVLLKDQIPDDRFPGYCEATRQSIELVFLSVEDERPREYEPRRRKFRG